MNKVILIGNLTKDPELRTTPSGVSVTKVGIATNKKWIDQQGNKQEKAEFHNVVMWRGLAETFAKYMTKGSKCLIEGELQTRKWEDKDGITRYSTEIIANNVEFLGEKKQQEEKRDIREEDVAPVEEEEINIEDIPF